MDNDALIARRVKRFERLREERRTFWDRRMEEAARFCLPCNAGFLSDGKPPKDVLDETFDDTAQEALHEAARFFVSLTMPSGKKYQGITTGDDKLDNKFSGYLEATTKAIFRARYDYQANFEANMFEALLSWLCFSAAPIMVEERKQKSMVTRGIRYRASDLRCTYFGTDSAGLVNEFTRRFPLRALEAVGRFGAENLPEKIRESAKGNDDEFEFQHCCWPRQDYDPERLDAKGQPFESVYIAIVEGEKAVVEGTGYHEFPMPFPRYSTAPRQKYGPSPVMRILGTIRLLNEMCFTTIRGAQLAVEPPVNLFDDGIMTQFSQTPRALNWGAVDDQGRQLAVPFQTGGRVELGLEMEEQRRMVIRDALFARESEVLLSNPDMTATQSVIVRQLLGQKAAPAGSRLQNEGIGPMTAREMGILERQGRIDAMPQGLAEALEGEGLSLKYDNPLSRLLEMDEAQAVLVSLEQAAALESIKPGAMRRVKVDDALEKLWRANGAPADLLYDDDELKAIKDQEQQQLDAAQALEAAPVIGETAEKLAKAGALNRAPGAPGGGLA